MKCNKLFAEALDSLDKHGNLAVRLTSSAISGAVSGIQVNDDGTIKFDPIKAAIGAAIGARYSNISNLKGDIEAALRVTSRNAKLEWIRRSIRPLGIIDSGYAPATPAVTRFEMQMEKVPRALKSGEYEKNNLWKRGKFFLDLDGQLRKWIDITKVNIPKSKRTTLKRALPELRDVTGVKINRELENSSFTSGFYNPDEEYIGLRKTPTAKDATTILHESQHALQDYNLDFGRGSSPRRPLVKEAAKKWGLSPGDIYEGDVGETYARLAERGTLKELPTLTIINKSRGKLYNFAPGKEFNEFNVYKVFGNIEEPTKSELIYKVNAGKVKAKDLPEIRRFIKEAAKYPDLPSDEKKLKGLGFVVRKPIEIHSLGDLRKVASELPTGWQDKIRLPNSELSKAIKDFLHSEGKKLSSTMWRKIYNINEPGFGDISGVNLKYVMYLMDKGRH